MKGEGQARPALPAGQRALDHFPRFGAPSYAARLPSQIAPDFTLEISVAGFACAPITKADLEQLPRVDCVADFHCVATWTAPGLRWSGYAFRDVVEQLLRPRIPAAAFGNYVEFSVRWELRTMNRGR